MQLLGPNVDWVIAPDLFLGRPDRVMVHRHDRRMNGVSYSG